MKRWGCLLAALAVTGCSGDAVKDALTNSPCAGDRPLGTVETFLELGAATEGITFGPDGRMYVAEKDSGVIWAVAADGVKTKFAVTPSALGMAFLDKDLIVAGFSTDAVYTVDAGGKDAVLAAPVTQPNFVTPTPWGSVLVSNDFASKISEVTPTSATTWSDAIYSPNGMAFTPGGDTLYVVTTFADEPGLWRVPVQNKTAGTPAKIVSLDPGGTPDGLALADDGTVFVALNVAGKLARIDPAAGSVQEEIKGLTFPASLAFGRGDFDACSLYVTQLFGKGVHRVSVGVTGR